MPLAVALAAVLTMLAAPAALSAQGEPVKSIWSGVYSAEQAARGQSEYATHCASCHRDDLSGYESLLKGERFMNKYREASLYLLFEKTKTTMPRNAGGSLSDQTYVDIVSYVLKANDFPAGAGELTVDALAGIKLVGKDGPEPVPDFALVQVVGCLSQRASDSAWVVNNSTDPVRAGHPQPAPEELASTRATTLGTNSFRLQVSAAQNPVPHANRKVEVRGFLIRRPNENRINLTSLETVATDCP
jgi:mono/diheme cytochrome c family protein